MDSKTIYALATPPGKSGVAVIRVSGDKALHTLEALGVKQNPPARLATLATLRDADGNTIDKALVFYFAAPNSFTGEEVVEYHVHGSRAVIQQILNVLSGNLGVRQAQPGEFTRRAFLNGKMDLTAAEGLADLIDAETEAQRKQAMRLMQGEAATFYENLRAGIVHALAYMEAYIDFPDEDIPEHVIAQIAQEVGQVAKAIEAQLAAGNVSEKIRDGVYVAILGPPNVGKSSLMNLLARRDVAIVSETAGTTRDVIEIHLDIKGYSVILADTAGIREHADLIEKEGIRRSFARAKEADLKIIMLEAGAGEGSIAKEIEELIDNQSIILINKSDLSGAPSSANDANYIAISVKTRAGVDRFLAELEQRIDNLCGTGASFITRIRHREHLTQALDHIDKFNILKASGLELQCEELRRAAVEIGKITGKIEVDELLGQIFSSFCIGK